MNDYIKEEFKKAFISKKTLMSIIILILTTLLGAIEYLVRSDFPFGSGYMFTFSYISGIPAVIIPILISIPFINSYNNELESNFLKYLFMKISPIKYGIIKIVVNFIVSGSVLFIGSLSCYTFFYLYRGVVNDGNSYVVASNLYHIFLNSQPKYFILLILFATLGAMSFSTFGLGMSTLVKNKYVSVLFLFFYSIISGAFFSNINIYINSQILFNFSFNDRVNSLSMLLIVNLVYFSVGVILFMYDVIKKGKKIGYV